MKRKVERPDYSLYDLEDEIQRLKQASEHLNLIIPDSFYKVLAVGDIIEIYQHPPINKQLYGNKEFGKLCSYSDEQMKSIPFPTLFWREPEFNEMLFKRASEVLITEDQATLWGLPDHELVESLHPRKRTFSMKMGWIAPCFLKSNPKEPWAWASTLRVDLIFQWPEDIE